MYIWIYIYEKNEDHEDIHFVLARENHNGQHLSKQKNMFDLGIEREQGIILTMVELANFDVWNLHKGSTILEFVNLCFLIGV